MQIPRTIITCTLLSTSMSFALQLVSNGDNSNGQAYIVVSAPNRVHGESDGVLMSKQKQAKGATTLCVGSHKVPSGEYVWCAAGTSATLIMNGGKHPIPQQKWTLIPFFSKYRVNPNSPPPASRIAKSWNLEVALRIQLGKVGGSSTQLIPNGTAELHNGIDVAIRSDGIRTRSDWSTGTLIFDNPHNRVIVLNKSARSFKVLPLDVTRGSIFDVSGLQGIKLVRTGNTKLILDHACRELIVSGSHPTKDGSSNFAADMWITDDLPSKDVGYFNNIYLGQIGKKIDGIPLEMHVSLTDDKVGQTAAFTIAATSLSTKVISPRTFDVPVGYTTDAGTIR